MHLLAACTPQDTPAGNNYALSVVSYPEGDIPLSTQKEVVLRLHNFTSKEQNLYFDFSPTDMEVIVEGNKVTPGAKVLYRIAATEQRTFAPVSFQVSGLTAGQHKVGVRSESGSDVAMCDFTVSMSERVYVVEVVNAPARMVGEQRTLDFRLLDPQDPQKYFAMIPGFKISCRPLNDTKAWITLGVDCVWDTLPEYEITGKQKFVPITYQDNIGGGLYKGYTIGENKIEYTIVDPEGFSSRNSVHSAYR